MYQYKIYTQDLNRQKVNDILSAYFNGYAIIEEGQFQLYIGEFTKDE